MKLANYLTLRLSFIFILILFIWSVVYFFIQMKEIYDGIDEGLNNLKQELILEANKVPDFIENIERYDPLNLLVEEISHEEAIQVKESYSTTNIYFESEEENEEVRMLTTAFLCTQNNKYYKVKFFTSTVESDDLVKNMFYLLSTLWVIMSFVLIITTQRIIYKSNKPFYTLLNKLKEFHLNETQMFDLPNTTISEYANLNQSIKELLEKNINVYAEQKNFIENASHELQTPIAIAISKLELMMSKENLTQQQLEEMNSVINSLGRAKRLNSSLLLLSKIKNKQFIGNEIIDLFKISEDVIENFEALIQYKNISVNIEQNGTPRISMNQDLAYILMNNLIKNAIVHNIIGGNIDIQFYDKSIIISNNGEAIPDGLNIFERYISNSENVVQSSGLGLSIVKSIIDTYKIKISHKYSAGMHSITLMLK